MTIPEWRVMAVLGQQPGLSADEVCSETAMEKVPVSRAVSKLLNKGLLNRNFSGRDRRRSIISLSEAGYGLYAQIVPLALSYEAELKAALTEQEQAQLEILLNKLSIQGEGVKSCHWIPAFAGIMFGMFGVRVKLTEFLL